MGLMDWFKSKPKCPIDDAARKWIDDRWEWLEEEFGPDCLRQAAVVIAEPEFFPDPYRGTPEDVRVQLDRVCKYMRVDPSRVQLALYSEQEAPRYIQGPHAGTAGLYEEQDGKARIWIETGSLLDPPRMLATMAHELGHVHLLGDARISPEEEDHEPLTDLLTVYLGLGVLTANSVVGEKVLREGAYSSWSVSRQGYLTMPQYGYAMARFARARAEDGRKWRRELRLDVRSAFDEAMRQFAEEDRAAGRRGP